MIIRPQALRRLAELGIVVGLVLVCWRSWAQPPAHPGPPKPEPDFPNIRYGPHERNVLDLWKAKPQSGKVGPPPVVVFFHGGGFRLGDKSSVPGWLVVKCLDAGISVASANYRLSDTAAFPAPMLDGARAIQYLRFHAKELGIDPRRIAASGSSAGAGIALWIGLHDDLADPRSPDPIARQSTRVACLGVERRPDLIRPSVHQEDRRRPRARALGAQAVLRLIRFGARYAQGSQALRGGVADQLRHGRRPAGHPLLRRAGRTPPRRRQAGAGDPPPPLRRGARRPSSTRSASNASSAIPRISPSTMIPETRSSARWWTSSSGIG